MAAAPSTANSQPSNELPLVKAEDADAEADVLMSDVAALAHTGQSADPVANLESALRPIERYAVRFLEEVLFHPLLHSFPSPLIQAVMSSAWGNPLLPQILTAFTGWGKSSS